MNDEQRINNEIERLRALLGVEPGRSPDAPSEADEAILASILAGQTSEAPRRSPNAVLARIAVAAVAVIALVIGVAAWQSDQTPATATTPTMLRFSGASVDDVIEGRAPSASESLSTIAASAASSAPTAGTGSQQVKSYAWYFNNTVDTAGTATVELAPTFQVTTLGPDGSLENRETRAPALSIDGRVIDPDHYPVGGAESEDRFPAGTMDPNSAAGLPRDPEALRQTLIANQGGTEMCSASDLSEAQCLYTGIVDLYTHWVVAPDLSATVWNMLADTPAWVDMGATVDRLGRTGHAIAIPPDPSAANQVAILIVDPASGQLLAWEQVTVANPELGITEPVVSGFQAISSALWGPPLG